MTESEYNLYLTGTSDMPAIPADLMPTKPCKFWLRDKVKVLEVPGVAESYILKRYGPGPFTVTEISVFWGRWLIEFENGVLQGLIVLEEDCTPV